MTFLSQADLMDSFEKTSEKVNTDIFDLLHTGVALVSKEGFFLFCNKAFLGMFNLQKDTIGKHVTDVFITGEQGVMSALRNQETIVCSSLTTENVQGISFRYPVLDDNGHLRGAIIESIPTSLGKEKLLSLMETVRNLEEATQYIEQNKARQTGRLYTFSDIIGECAPMVEMKALGHRFAASHMPILLYGESGTGKELVAQALHMASPRASCPFVTVNCAALPRELIESELFGYAAGSFTGAKSKGLVGKFEMANTGTIFLDEIGELPLTMQAKLLRVLESGEIQKIGHHGRLYSDFRLIGATNKDLAQMVRDGLFREDLYHRLNIFELAIPPLRKRLEDIPLLTRYFVEQHAGSARAKSVHVDSDVYKLFYSYRWLGNIRELKNVLAYAIYSLTDPTLLTIRDLPARFFTGLESAAKLEERPPSRVSHKVENRGTLSEASANAEKSAIVQTLIQCRYNKSLTAQALGISRNKLYKKLREYDLLESQTESEEN